MYLDNLVSGRTIIVIVNTSEIYNFVSMEEARKLGLTLEKRELCINTVNSKAKPIHKVVRDVAVKIES